MRKKIIGELMIRNLIKNLVIIFLILNILTYSFALANEHHVYECHDENCIICQIIEVARIVTRYSSVLEILLQYEILIYLIASLVNYRNSSLIQESLVFQKVQFNE
jgi:hypothetical protein